jgi:hypothetical protein
MSKKIQASSSKHMSSNKLLRWLKTVFKKLENSRFRCVFLDKYYLLINKKYLTTSWESLDYTSWESLGTFNFSAPVPISVTFTRQKTEVPCLKFWVRVPIFWGAVPKTAGRVHRPLDVVLYKKGTFCLLRSNNCPKRRI